MKFITTFQTGRKCRNKLAEKVSAILIEDLNIVIDEGLFKDAEFWRERIANVAQRCQVMFPKCKPIAVREHKNPYNKEYGSMSFSLYHSDNDTIDEGSFLSISVQSEAKYYTPNFHSYMTLNKECKHLYEFARDNYPNWRRGENETGISPWYIYPLTAKEALISEWAKDAYNAKTEAIIEQGENTISVKVKTPKTVNTAFSITLKPLWSK